MYKRYARKDNLSIKTYNQEIWNTIIDSNTQCLQFYNLYSQLQSYFDSFRKGYDIQHVNRRLRKNHYTGKENEITNMIWKEPDSKDMSISYSSIITKKYTIY